MAKNVEEFIQDIAISNANLHGILIELRKLFGSCGQDLAEGIKYGGLVFAKNERLVGGIFIYKNHLSLEFGQGAEFDDPDGLLEGKGKFRRHLKFTSEKDIEPNQTKAFIKQACRLNANCSP
ncbi:DUF1801 domain-containing protein [Microbulbifer sp. TYP-18]|uniref:DUF1801 domain-containing protein n=1 Tax=Microbulbifer sp. TYP-18 TaxID=3230024 RepID=UPI0034C66EE4